MTVVIIATVNKGLLRTVGTGENITVISNYFNVCTLRNPGLNPGYDPVLDQYSTWVKFTQYYVLLPPSVGLFIYQHWDTWTTEPHSWVAFYP